MDEENVDTYDGFDDSATTTTGVAAINSQYAVWFEHGHCNIQKLTSDDEPIQRLWSNAQDARCKPVLALSGIQPSILAVATGPRIQIWDLNIQACKVTLPGTGRTVTALGWSPLDGNVLTTGSIDGSICLWDLRASQRPLQRLRASRGPSQSIILNAADRHSVACVQDRQISIWDLSKHSVLPVRFIRAHDGKFNAAAWHPITSGRLLVATERSQLELYDVSHADTEGGDESSASSSDGEYQHVRSPQSAMSSELTPIWKTAIESAAKSIEYIDGNIFCALAWHGYKVFLYQTHDGETGASSLYAHDFETEIDAVHVNVRSSTGTISSIGTHRSNTVDLPVSILEAMISRFPNPEKASSEASSTDEKMISITNSTTEALPCSRTTTMRPVSIIHQQRISSGFPKTSNQIQLQRHSKHGKGPTRHAHLHVDATTNPSAPSTPPAKRGIVAGAELRSIEANDTPSMPFLSPSIPSRHSLSDLPSLEDSTLSLPPLAAPIPQSSSPSKVGTTVESRDSDDSDDDTFVEALDDSTTFLPGGINVPLPKGCGALFAPNGQLLTFFPPKPRPSSAQGGAIVTELEQNGRRRKGHSVSRVFPAFGKFGARKLTGGVADDAESTESSETSLTMEQEWPSFTLPQASFPSQQSWRSRYSAPKADYAAPPSQAKVVISVYEVNDVSVLCTSQRVLAEQYRIIPDGRESSNDICEHNAATAETAGLHDTAYIWNLIAMVLSDNVPLELLADENIDQDVLVVARRAKTLTRSDSGVDLTTGISTLHSHGQFRWADSPFGAPWLIRRALEWAEQRSDLQLLASICAVLTGAQRGGAQDKNISDFRRPTDANMVVDYVAGFAPQQQRRPNNRTAPPIPVLRTNSFANSSSVYESPVKVHRSSNTSSRNASLPTTPYLESNSSTPPFPLSLSRQGTHLSTSGSASPELQRSSFSAAAKYYAQSITDKFASYGTSPPTRKTGTSPGTSNELSASLPSGSWSKSVSFAMSSTTETTRGSPLSRSFDDPANDNAYDSDRTVEDDSLAYQHKELVGAIQIKEVNSEMFSDEISGAARLSLIPKDLAAKTIAWCQYYAEQLRSWNLQLRAAELEKVMGIACVPPPSSGVEPLDVEQHGPRTSGDRSVDKTCSVCFTAVRLMEVVCLSCRHVSHFECLEDYITADEAPFECPASCGCHCPDIVYATESVQNTSPQTRPHFKKRMPSYTDPRSWRTRVEGDNSW